MPGGAAFASFVSRERGNEGSGKGMARSARAVCLSRLFRGAGRCQFSRSGISQNGRTGFAREPGRRGALGKGLDEATNPRTQERVSQALAPGGPDSVHDPIPRKRGF